MPSSMGKSMLKQEVLEHLGHVDYPATGKQLLEACNKMADVPAKDKQWFKETIPAERTFRSADEVKKLLKM